ncbi:MAG: 1-deoxy-D-xylulose-5-phosphate reductoisomerase [Bradymonadales bacterium]|nr:MAG: 1-deoxy-D-xylulose-5-phosphate reductoisomerase [Bradymonadales bacterium]
MLRAPKKLCLLGSTGSVGESSLRVLRQRPTDFDLVGLACGRRVDLLVKQIKEFGVRRVSVADEEAFKSLQALLKKESIQLDFVGFGSAGHAELVEATRPDVLMAAMSGTSGLPAVLRAIEIEVPVLGVANKEILVMAGSFIRAALESSKTQLVPVDSEHSAIFQALRGNELSSIRRIILTASGGPFRSSTLAELKRVRVEQALKHPNWSMGAKISIDSATMMNKGLEYIEALQLFPISREQLEVVVHPQSIVHSIVEYWDHSMMAQMGISDMQIPVAYAMGYPHRLPLKFSEALDLVSLGRLDFEAVDLNKFPCLALAMEAERTGAAACVALNAANEIVVECFLRSQIEFLAIPQWVEAALAEFSGAALSSLESAIELDQEVKAWTRRQLGSELDLQIERGQNRNSL